MREVFWEGAVAVLFVSVYWPPILAMRCMPVACSLQHPLA